MINVADPHCNECTKQASFNYPNKTRAEYCYFHKKDDMINIYSKCCKKENCNIIIRPNNRYEGYCINCYKILYPENKITINYLVKERSVRDFIQLSFPEYKFLFNKILQKELSRYIPDILLQLENHNIIVEVDEYQHSSYEETSEIARMNEIHNILGMKTIFIRFNPDSYVDDDNNKIKSPWIYYKNNLQISSNKKLSEEWNKRLNNLKNKIIYYMENIPEEEFTEIRLYYNEFIGMKW